jgi:glycosyltransferase involved in cell wall biosynthesis
MQLPIRQEMTLIYDRDVSGHHLDFLQFLITYLEGQPVAIRQQYIFAVNPAARHRFETNEQKIDFRYLSQTKIDEFESENNTLKRATSELKHLEELAERHGTKKIILMHLDAFQYELGKSYWQQSPLRFSGILFLPFRSEYEPSDSLILWLKRELKGLRKSLQMRWLLQNKNVEELFILNDSKAVSEYNTKYDNRFLFVPDPAPNFAPDGELQSIESIKIKYKINPKKKILLIFGNISTRKNIRNILSALVLLSESEQDQILLLICGEPDLDYGQTLANLLVSMAESLSRISIVTNFNFVSPTEADAFFKMSTLILAPYINFYNSSGAVALAAKYNVPIITSDNGIAADIVQKYELGYVVNPHSPVKIAEGIDFYLKNKVGIDGAKYLDDFSSATFSKKILHLY